MHGLAGTTIAGVFGITAFVVALLSGAIAGNDALSIVSRAFLALVVCYPVGFAAGLILQRVIDEHIDEHRARNPAPDSDSVINGSPVDGADAEDGILEV